MFEIQSYGVATYATLKMWHFYATRYKGFTEEDIENLSKGELDRYFQEYVESERKNT